MRKWSENKKGKLVDCETIAIVARVILESPSNPPSDSSCPVPYVTIVPLDLATINPITETKRMQSISNVALSIFDL